MKHLRRAAAFVPLAVLAACTDKEISEGIEDAILSVLGTIGKVILISFGLILAWSATVAIGIVCIVLGVRRKRIDPLAVASMIVGGGIVVAAWPLVFSQSGLAGRWAPGSTGNVSAGPVVGQIAAVALAIGAAVVLVRRHRRKAAVRQRPVAAGPIEAAPELAAPDPVAPEPVAPEPVAPGLVVPATRVRSARVPKKRAPAKRPGPARPRAKAGSKTR